jgi:outer membrane receptor protein involved in Fe transport
VLVEGVRVEAGVRNLLDRAYPELRAGGFVSPGQPRAVYVTVSRRFGR